MMAPMPHMKPRLVQSFRRLGAHLWPPWQLAVAWEPAVRRLNEGGTAGANAATGRKAELSEAAASSSQTVPSSRQLSCMCMSSRPANLGKSGPVALSPFS